MLCQGFFSSLPPFLPTDSDVICTWSGQLPPRRHKNPTYSPRVFLGGVPWDITETALLATFQPCGNLTVDWPGKDSKHSRHPPKGQGPFLRDTRAVAFEVFFCFFLLPLSWQLSGTRVFC